MSLILQIAGGFIVGAMIGDLPIEDIIFISHGVFLIIIAQHID